MNAFFAEPRRSGGAGRVLGWLALVLVLVVGLRLLVLSSAVGPDGALHRHVDGVMFVGHVWNAAFGEIAGRDYVSTYGPLAQWIAAEAAGLRTDGDIRSSAPLALLGLRVAAFLVFALWLAVLPGGGAPRTAAGLGLLLLFAAPRQHPTLRVGLALLAVTCSARSSEAGGRVRRWTLAAAGGLALLATQLVTPDFAVYGAVALAAAVFADRWLPPRRDEAGGRRRFAQSVSATLATWIGANLLLWIGFAVTSRRAGAGWLDYPRESIRMIRTYAWAVGRPFSESGTELAGLAAFALATAWCAVAAARRSAPERRAHWLALALLGLFAIKGGLVRSGSGHVALALTATLAVWTALLPRRSQGARIWLVWSAVGLLAWSVWPDPASRQSLRQAGRALGSSLAPAWNSLTSVPASEAGLPRRLRDLDRAEGGDAPLYAYPFENQLGPYFGRRLVTPTHQAYAAHDAEMQRMVVDRLRAEPLAPEVVLSLGGLAGADPSPQRNATRASVIFEYLLGAYRWAPRIVDGGSLRLMPATPRELAWRRLELRSRPAQGSEGEPEVRSYDLAEPNDCRVVALELTIDYPFWRTFGWPGRLEASFRERGREVASTRVVPLALGEPFRALAVLVPVLEFPGLFDEPPSATPVAIDQIRLAARDPGGLGVRPKRFELTGAECF